MRVLPLENEVGAKDSYGQLGSWSSSGDHHHESQHSRKIEQSSKPKGQTQSTSKMDMERLKYNLTSSVAFHRVHLANQGQGKGPPNISNNSGSREQVFYQRPTTSFNIPSQKHQQQQRIDGTPEEAPPSTSGIQVIHFGVV